MQEVQVAETACRSSLAREFKALLLGRQRVRSIGGEVEDKQEPQGLVARADRGRASFMVSQAAREWLRDEKKIRRSVL